MPLPASKLKRKVKGSALASRKKAKTQHLSAENLPWTTVSRPQEAGLDSGLDGLLELEEVENVEVVYEDTEGGRVVKFNVVGENSDQEEVLEASDEEGPSKRNNERSVQTISPALPIEVEAQEVTTEPGPPFDAKALLPDWQSFALHSQLYRALYSQQFSSPTPIQSKALPAATKGKDVVGVAETGSGKTLAYGLPVLHYLLSQASINTIKSSQTKTRRSVKALILTPTRELALQVSSHLNVCLNPVDVVSPDVKVEEEEPSDLLSSKSTGSGQSSKQKGKAKHKGKAKAMESNHTATKPNGPPLVSVAAIVGGMSPQKQRRILDRGVDVLVATPGRLWDILQEDDDLACQIKSLRFLVLDEADRMIETGHFAELDNILRLTLRQKIENEIEPETEVNGSGQDKKVDVDASEETTEFTEGSMQTFVFSATLSKDLQRNLKKRRSAKNRKHGKPASTLDDLLMKLDFRDPEPEIIDLSPEGGMVSTLKESKIECLPNAKDAYLYYFLLRYPGRTLVFLSSIDGIRRLMPLMELLELNACPLHSQLEQRQRLKNLDRFRSSPHSVLLATDIAARGLDIPAVDHVVHYQIPRSADVYVHRNGRTARAMRSGFSLLMCAPDERKLVRALLGSLGRKEEEVPEMSVELYLLDKLKARIQLARQIDSAQHKIKKENHERSWLRETAEAMEIELDSDLGLSSDGERDIPSRQKKKAMNAKTSALKAELKQLLAQPLIARGISTRYITSGSRSVADDMMSGEYHETMVGLRKTRAGQDIVPTKPRNKVKKEEYEEWNGFGS